jgi:hypothetical protein
MPESSDRWQSMENQPFPTLSVIGDRSELSGIGITRSFMGRFEVAIVLSSRRVVVSAMKLED